MDRFIGVLEIVLPVMTMIALGVLMRRRNLVSEAGISDMKWVVNNVCIPVVLFRAFWTMTFTWREGLAVVLMMVVSLAALWAGFIVCGRLAITQRTAPYLCTTIEGGGVGYPLFILLFGAAQVSHIALLDVGNAIIQWGVVLTLLKIRSGEGGSAKDTLRSLANPVNFAIIAGVFLGLTGLGATVAAQPAGSVVAAVLDFAATPTSAIILITIGYGLEFSNIDVHEVSRTIAARAAIGAVLFTVVWLAMGLIFPDDSLYRWAVMLFYLLPPTYAFGIFTQGEDEEAFVSTVLALYTLITVAGFTVMTWLAA